jgi:serine/threonine-protein kinase
VSFSDGEPVHTVRVALDPEASRRYARRSFRPAARPKRPANRRPSRATSGTLLNMNSIPVSNVILDGHVLGSTPVIGRAVSPGSHTVVFVHPDGKRKIVSTTVGAGERKTAYVRF